MRFPLNSQLISVIYILSPWAEKYLSSAKPNKYEDKIINISTIFKIY